MSKEPIRFCWIGSAASSFTHRQREMIKPSSVDTRRAHSHLLDFSRGGAEKFDVARADNFAMLGQSFGALVLCGEHDEGVACGTPVVFLNEQDASVAVHYIATLAFGARFEKFNLKEKSSF